MKFKLPKVSKVFLKEVGLPLEFDDSDKPMWVEVRQATQADQMKRADYGSNSTRVLETDEEGKTKIAAIQQTWNSERVKQLEIYLTLAGAGEIDLVDPRDDDKFAPAFRFIKEDGIPRLNMTEDEFGKVIGRLPQAVVDAIHNAVLTENDHWNFS